MSHDAILDLLADELKDYAETLHQAITVSTLINVHDNMSEVAQSKLGLYLARIRDYFSSNAECIAFVHARAENLNREADDLVCYSSVVKGRCEHSHGSHSFSHPYQKREIIECEALCMTATVSQMTDSLVLNRQYLTEDNTVICDLIVESRKMIEDLVSTLELYITPNYVENKDELPSQHITLLRSICLATAVIGVKDDSRLDGFLQRYHQYNRSSCDSISKWNDNTYSENDKESSFSSDTFDEEGTVTCEQAIQERHVVKVDATNTRNTFLGKDVDSFNSNTAKKKTTSLLIYSDYSSSDNEFAYKIQIVDKSSKSLIDKRVEDLICIDEASEVAGYVHKKHRETTTTSPKPKSLNVPTSIHLSSVLAMPAKFTWATVEPIIPVPSLHHIQQEI